MAVIKQDEFSALLRSISPSFNNTEANNALREVLLRIVVVKDFAALGTLLDAAGEARKTLVSFVKDDAQKNNLTHDGLDLTVVEQSQYHLFEIKRVAFAAAVRCEIERMPLYDMNGLTILKNIIAEATPVDEDRAKEKANQRVAKALKEFFPEPISEFLEHNNFTGQRPVAEEATLFDHEPMRDALVLSATTKALKIHLYDKAKRADKDTLEAMQAIATLKSNDHQHISQYFSDEKTGKSLSFNNQQPIKIAYTTDAGKAALQDLRDYAQRLVIQHNVKILAKKFLADLDNEQGYRTHRGSLLAFLNAGTFDKAQKAALGFKQETEFSESQVKFARQSAANALIKYVFIDRLEDDALNGKPATAEAFTPVLALSRVTAHEDPKKHADAIRAVISMHKAFLLKRSKAGELTLADDFFDNTLDQVLSDEDAIGLSQAAKNYVYSYIQLDNSVSSLELLDAQRMQMPVALFGGVNFISANEAVELKNNIDLALLQFQSKGFKGVIETYLSFDKKGKPLPDNQKIDFDKLNRNEAQLADVNQFSMMVFLYNDAINRLADRQEGLVGLQSGDAAVLNGDLRNKLSCTAACALISAQACVHYLKSQLAKDASQAAENAKLDPVVRDQMQAQLNAFEDRLNYCTGLVGYIRNREANTAFDAQDERFKAAEAAYRHCQSAEAVYNSIFAPQVNTKARGSDSAAGAQFQHNPPRHYDSKEAFVAGMKQMFVHELNDNTFDPNNIKDKKEGNGAVFTVTLPDKSELQQVAHTNAAGENVHTWVSVCSYAGVDNPASLKAQFLSIARAMKYAQDGKTVFDIDLSDIKPKTAEARAACKEAFKEVFTNGICRIDDSQAVSVTAKPIPKNRRPGFSTASRADSALFSTAADGGQDHDAVSDANRLCRV